MPVYKLDEIGEEFVTPKHSTAFGRLVTGEQVELGVLRYKAGEGAEEHAHPQEQIFLVLSGRVRMTIAGKAYELGPRQVAHMPPNDRKLTIGAICNSDGAVELSVSDRGVGVGPERLEEIFEPFVTTKDSGLGLGLAICRSIVSAHGGRLWAVNNADQGATFLMMLSPADGGVRIENPMALRPLGDNISSTGTR